MQNIALSLSSFDFIVNNAREIVCLVEVLNRIIVIHFCKFCICVLTQTNCSLKRNAFD